MAALDGGFVRILTEYGFIGCFLFWKVLASIYRQSVQLRWMVIAFLISGTHLLLDYALIYGHFGLPRLGLKGAAIAAHEGAAPALLDNLIEGSAGDRAPAAGKKKK